AIAVSAPYANAGIHIAGVGTLTSYVTPLSSTILPWLVMPAIVGSLLGGGAAHLVALLIRMAFPLAFLFWYGAALRRSWKYASQRPRAVAALWGGAFLLLVVASPVVQPWYLVWLAPFAAALSHRARVVFIVLSVSYALYGLA